VVFARLFAGLISFALLAHASSRPVLLTTDCGADMDDQWVIAHLLLSPRFNVRAIVTTHTGSHALLPSPQAGSSARIAREVLDHLALQNAPPVIPGSDVPLRSRTPFNNAGVARILSEARRLNGPRLTVVVTGAATDVASALLLDADLENRIEIVAMGFKGPEEGGDEFNVTNDPIAWQVILDSRVPLTIGGSSVARRDLSLPSQQVHARLDRSGATGSYLAGLFDRWLDLHSELVRQVMSDPAHWPVWDEVTVACMLGMAKVRPSARPSLRSDLTFEHPPGRGTIDWVTGIEAPRLWRNLEQMLRKNASGRRRARDAGFAEWQRASVDRW